MEQCHLNRVSMSLLYLRVHVPCGVACEPSGAVIPVCGLYLQEVDPSTLGTHLLESATKPQPAIHILAGLILQFLNMCEYFYLFAMQSCKVCFHYTGLDHKLLHGIFLLPVTSCVLCHEVDKVLDHDSIYLPVLCGL